MPTAFAYAIAYAIAYASLRQPYATRHVPNDLHCAPNTFRQHLIKYLTRGLIEPAICFAMSLSTHPSNHTRQSRKHNTGTKMHAQKGETLILMA